MLNSRFHYPLFLAGVTLWWGLTIISDVVVAPSIFRVVENFFNAGDLAMTIFSRANSVELVLSSFTLVLAIMIMKRKGSLGTLILTIVCWSVAMFYFSYLIPKIIELTELWKKAEAMGVIGIGDIPDLQQEHQYFHRIYIILDSFKLIVLSILLGQTIFRQDRLA